MIISIFTVVLSLILGAIAALHVYWAFGGEWAARAAIPTDSKGQPLFSPGPVACVAVALAAAFAAALVAARLMPSMPDSYPTVYMWFPWVLCAVFAIRVIGDFRYCGVFKRVRGTLFAKSDDRIFTPLCIFLSVSSGIVAGQ